MARSYGAQGAPGSGAQRIPPADVGQPLPRLNRTFEAVAGAHVPGPMSTPRSSASPASSLAKREAAAGDGRDTLEPLAVQQQLQASIVHPATAACGPSFFGPRERPGRARAESARCEVATRRRGAADGHGTGGAGAAPGASFAKRHAAACVSMPIVHVAGGTISHHIGCHAITSAA